MPMGQRRFDRVGLDSYWIGPTGHNGRPGTLLSGSSEHRTQGNDSRASPRPQGTDDRSEEFSRQAEVVRRRGW